MKKKWTLFVILAVIAASFICSSFLSASSPFEQTKDLPVAYQGRFRSLEAVSRLWLYDIYHQQQLKASDLKSFNTNNKSALELLWRFHILGHTTFDHAPFFWMHYAETKTLLGLDTAQDRFSYTTLLPLLDLAKISPMHSSENKQIFNEISQLVQAMQLFREDQEGLNSEKEIETALTMLIEQGKSQEEISRLLEARYPLNQRLLNAGSTFKMLPSRFSKGEWLSLHALKAKVYKPSKRRLELSSNFTAFPNDIFDRIRSAYFDIEKAIRKWPTSNDQLEAALDAFTNAMLEGYALLEGTTYKEAAGKALDYPTFFHLKAETLYYQLPLIELAIVIYGVALFLFILTLKLNRHWIDVSAFLALIIAFMLHTSVLILRCYVLQRPPVSNMFETIVYVPWIAIVISSIFYVFSRSRLLIAAAVLGSLLLLILLKLTQVDARMENVQAVLDSQYWLIVHVLMVVGSYGAFIVSGILGHFYLILFAQSKGKSKNISPLAQSILHTMYAGVALLIPGTILGGVWAAESWGRFWDWDPKESWAFISACVYLLVIHAYTFRRIKDFGLAVGSIAGLIAISFTWYGVNYILGTGLHSYGFGQGGEKYYFLYLILESLFLILMTISYVHVQKPGRLRRPHTG